MRGRAVCDEEIDLAVLVWPAGQTHAGLSALALEEHATVTQPRRLHLNLEEPSAGVNNEVIARARAEGDAHDEARVDVSAQDHPLAAIAAFIFQHIRFSPLQRD